MHLQLTQGDRKLLLTAGIIFVLLIGLSALIVRGGNSDEEVPTVYSTASGGCKVAYLLLQESGYKVETWERPLNELPPGRRTTLVIAEPNGFPAQGEKEKLAEYLQGGGRVIATGRFAGFYLPVDEAYYEPLVDSERKRIAALSPSPITRAAPEITLAPRAHWKSQDNGVALYGSNERPVAVEYRVGEGSVLWLAEPSPLTNSGLKEVGNLEFLFAAVGKTEGNAILWDEYVHGYEQRPISSRSRGILAWIFVQFAVLGLAIMLTYSRRNGTPWTPEVERRLSPLEFVRTLGTLYESAKASAVAVQISYQRFHYLLTRRLGMSVNSSAKDLDRTLRNRGLLSDERFAGLLAECEAVRYDPHVKPSEALRLIQALFDYAVRLKLIRSKESENKRWKQ